MRARKIVGVGLRVLWALAFAALWTLPAHSAESFSGSSQYATSSNAPISALPFSVSCWFKTTNVSAAQGLIAFGKMGAAGDQSMFGILIRGDNTRTIDAQSVSSGGTGVSASTANSYTSGVWSHVVALFTSTTSRSIILDNGTAGTNTTLNGPNTPTSSVLGGRALSATPDIQFAGQAAECAVWANVTLTADEITMLSRGYAPACVHRAAPITAYWPAIQDSSAIASKFFVPTLDLTVTGATASEHPRIINCQ